MHGRSGTRNAVLTSVAPPIPAAEIAQQVRAALAEDVGTGDVTASLVPAEQRITGRLLAREAAVLCGRAWADEVFRQLDERVRLSWNADDGDTLEANAIVFTIAGPARAILTGERTAMNFLQTLSATATAARRYVEAVAGTGCRILDTRKTIPGLRHAQKYASRCGGARNHRMGLHDMVLIKENHIAAAGSIATAVANARRLAPGIAVEVEVESLAELDAALDAGADIIMLDELAPADMRTAVARNRARAKPAKLEASGSITLETVRAVAQTGVDFISIGSITKHVRAVDLSLRLDFPRHS